MPQFHFDLQRSKAPEDQLSNVDVDVLDFRGEFGAENAGEAWKLITKMLFLPGKWTCRMRQGNRWLKDRIIRVLPNGTREELNA